MYIPVGDAPSTEDSVEIKLFEIRIDLLLKKVSPKEAAAQYRTLLSRIKDKQRTWNGVKDKTRVDSYFNPFGNLTLDHRIKFRGIYSSRKSTHCQIN